MNLLKSILHNIGLVIVGFALAYEDIVQEAFLRLQNTMDQGVAILKLRRTFEEQDELTSSLLPGFSCNVASIFKT